MYIGTKYYWHVLNIKIDDVLSSSVDQHQDSRQQADAGALPRRHRREALAGRFGLYRRAYAHQEGCQRYDRFVRPCWFIYRQHLLGVE